jgi:asparagine synthase (glutamine-hydrolysing)
MCGIAGILSSEKRDVKNQVNNMLNIIKHRGPDQKKIFTNSFGSFGFVRLKIIDLSDNSNQPFVSRDQKVRIIFNGEIYNYKELKKDYFNKVKFKSDGDGEVLLHLYLKFGINFLEKIKGMFAIVIADERLNKVFLIRDRFGIKPLYYSFISESLYFCSEISGIKKNINKNFEFNLDEMQRYFKQGLINSSNETWFKNINQVPASSYLIYNKSTNIKKIKYYQIEDHVEEDFDNKKISFKEHMNKIEKKMLHSFDEHNNYDVKAGVHLSGGVDSAVLAGLINRKKMNMDSYTFDFEKKEYSEVYFAEKISNEAKLNNFKSILKESELEKYLLKVLDREYEPFSSLRILSQHKLYDEYKNNVRVIFDGSGGDEIGAGYSYYMIPWYLDLLKYRKKNKVKRSFYRGLPQIINKTLKNSDFIKGSFGLLRYPGTATIDGSSYMNLDIFSDKFLSLDNKLKIKKPFKSYLRNAQYSDLYYLKLPRSLRYIDRASMHNSIEARVPLLDHKLVEYSLQIPSKFKFLNNQQRIIMKYPIKKFIDKQVLYQNKRTIADPQTIWLKTVLKDFFYDTINSSSFNYHGVFKKKNLINYYEKLLKQKTHFNSFLIFQVLICELWFQKIFLNR